MTAQTSGGEDAAAAGLPPVQLRILCQPGAPPRNNSAACVAPLSSVVLPPLSSALALVVLLALLLGIVVVSLATFHLHKRKLRKRKVQRAQEEYERDSRRSRSGPASTDAGTRREPPKPCTIIRPPPSRDVESQPGDPAAAAGCSEHPSSPVHQSDTSDTEQGVLKRDSGVHDHGEGHTVVSS